MKASEIISAYYRKKGEDPAKYLAGVTRLLNIKGAVLLQESDTVLLVVNIGDQKAELHLFTQESPLKVNTAVRKFVKKLKASDIKMIYGENDSQLPQILRSLKINAVPIENPKYQWFARL
jgi:NhaP-type Na+/H+ and K+/H+ antiporter